MPSNPQTAAQMNVRSTFAGQARRWDALTESQRSAWTAAAVTHQTKPRCGTSGPMTGLQFFVQVNPASNQPRTAAPFFAQWPRAPLETVPITF